MKETVTPRGFKLVTFDDEYRLACSLQESSRATEACIWLGVDQIEGNPARMHLTQEQVQSLLPYLTTFVETGQL